MKTWKTHLLVAAILAATIAGSLSHGAEFFWNQPSGGLFGDPGNWNDGASGVPGAGDVAIFDLVSTHLTVDLTEPRANERLVVRRGQMRLEMSNDEVVYEMLGGTPDVPGIVIGEARLVAGATVPRGMLRATHVGIGQALTSAGTFELGSGNADDVGALEADVVLVGAAGTGVMELLHASAFVRRFELGGAETGYGELIVGSNATLTIEDELVVGGAGLGVMDVRGAVTAGSAVFGRDDRSQSRLTIDRGAMTIAGDLEMRRDAAFVFVRGERLEVGGAMVAPLPIQFNLRGTSSAISSIAVAGRASIGGIVVELASDFEPNLGDFSLVTAGSGLAGTPITTPDPPIGLAWDTIVTDTELLLRACPDCNTNVIPDEQDIADGTSGDCNGNIIPDECDIADGISEDCDEDGVPDECTPADVRRLLDAIGSAGDAFGAAVDVDGGCAVVGSPNATPPFATVFVQRGTRWVREARLDAASDEPGDGFARSVGIGGSTIVVGAPAADGGAGAAHVFERGASGAWAEAVRLTPPDATADIDAFGASVASNGDNVIVGARRTSGSQFGGFAYIFARARAWELDRVFGTALNTVSGPGASVDIDGNLAAVLWPGTGEGDPARVAAVERLPGGFWFGQTVFTAEGTIVGSDIAVSGDAIAARIESDDFRGVGVALQVSPSTFRFETLLEQPESDSFGAAIGISDGRLAVGAVGDGPAGRVYTYRQIMDGTWYPGETLEVPGVGAIGNAVALEGGRLITGAPTDDAQGRGAGAAWIADLPGPDCNANGVPDVCDIIDGTSADADGDGVPDECADTCPWDLDESGVVGFNDLSIVLASWGSCPNCLADVNGSGTVGFLELSDLLVAWGDCP